LARFSGTYYEPFLGGGAVFFALRPSRAVLSDLNSSLINAYRVVRDHPHELLQTIKRIEVSAAAYYQVRASKPTDEIAQAAKLLYLNRLAFAGMYRENRRGEFNVPYGGDRTPDALWRSGLVDAASDALSGVEVTQCDFSLTLRRAQEGDLVYCDPTYTVTHNMNGFRRYNERNFSWHDQERLAAEAADAAGRGATVLVSNAFHPSVRALYPVAEAIELKRRSAIARSPANRGNVSEYLFVLTPA
jgi:DNA adenine methylase